MGVDIAARRYALKVHAAYCQRYAGCPGEPESFFEEWVEEHKLPPKRGKDMKSRVWAAFIRILFDKNAKRSGTAKKRPRRRKVDEGGGEGTQLPGPESETRGGSAEEEET